MAQTVIYANWGLLELISGDAVQLPAAARWERWRGIPPPVMQLTWQFDSGDENANLDKGDTFEVVSNLDRSANLPEYAFKLVHVQAQMAFKGTPNEGLVDQGNRITNGMLCWRNINQPWGDSTIILETDSPAFTRPQSGGYTVWESLNPRRDVTRAGWVNGSTIKPWMSWSVKADYDANWRVFGRLYYLGWPIQQRSVGILRVPELYQG